MRGFDPPELNLLTSFPVESPAFLETRVETASRLFKFTRVLFGKWPEDSDEALFSHQTFARPAWPTSMTHRTPTA